MAAGAEKRFEPLSRWRVERLLDYVGVTLVSEGPSNGGYAWVFSVPIRSTKLQSGAGGHHILKVEEEWGDTPWAICQEDHHLPTRNRQFECECEEWAHRILGEADVHEQLDRREPEEDLSWIIPGMLAKGERVIVIGDEGAGKSTLLRQVAVQVAAGIHPFTLEDMPSRRTVLVDLENPAEQFWSDLQGLVARAGDRLQRGYLTPVHSEAGMELVDEPERMQSALRGADLHVIGPLYRTTSGDLSEEMLSKRLADVLLNLGSFHRPALIIEAHMPHAGSGGRRPQRPYGASLWKRWPEFGLVLGNSSSGGDVTLGRFRGDRVRGRAWPAALRPGRNDEWPWIAADGPQPRRRTAMGGDGAGDSAVAPEALLALVRQHPSSTIRELTRRMRSQDRPLAREQLAALVAEGRLVERVEGRRRVLEVAAHRD